MDELAEGVLTFIRWTDEHPLPPNASTLVVLNALRAHLDATAPGWRTRAFKPTERDAVEVEVHLRGGRVVCGALVQQSSAARGEVR